MTNVASINLNFAMRDGTELRLQPVGLMSGSDERAQLFQRLQRAGTACH